MRYSKNFCVSVAILSIALFLTGCDQLKAFQEYFSKKSQSKQAVVEQPQAVPAVTQEIPLGPLPANVLARVGTWTMTMDDFKEKLNNLKQAMPDFDITTEENQNAVLDELVNQQILVVEAENKRLSYDKEVFKALEEFRRTILVQKMVSDMVENIKVTEAEAQALYNERKDFFVEPIELHVREIVMDSQAKAKEVLVDLLKGGDFAEAAKQYSKGKTAAQGGDLGFITQVSFPEMGNALMALDVGGVSNVFKGPDGFYIVKVEEKKGGAQVPFEKIKDEIIRNMTLSKQQQTVLDYIAQLRQKTKIDINQDLLKSLLQEKK